MVNTKLISTTLPLFNMIYVKPLAKFKKDITLDVIDNFCKGKIIIPSIKVVTDINNPKAILYVVVPKVKYAGTLTHMKFPITKKPTIRSRLLRCNFVLRLYIAEAVANYINIFIYKEPISGVKVLVKTIEWI